MPDDRSIFPTLRIDPKDVYGSWKMFIDRFTVAVRYSVKNKGTKRTTVGSQEREVPVFDDEMKLCALLNAVSNEGFHVLEAQGIDIESPELTYAQALQALKNTYEREESLNVKLSNFCSARQQTGEDSRDYLRRVEHLSRTTGIFKAFATGLNPQQTTAANTECERIRKTMAQVTVVNGLQDLKLRRELMAKHDLDWESLTTILSCRGTATESELKLERPTPQALRPNIPIKQEVAEARFDDHRRNDSRSRYDRFYNGSRERDSRQSRGYDRYHRSGSRPRGFRSPSPGGYGSSKRFDSRDRGYDRSYRRDSRDRRYDSSYSGYYNRPRSYSREYRRDSSRDSERSKNACFNCGDHRHRIRFCPEVTCHLCNKKGHMSRDCSKERSSNHTRPDSRDRKSNDYPSRETRSNDYGSRDARSNDYPKPLRSRDPSPYPDRGRRVSPNHYMEVRRVNVNPDKLFGKS